MSDTIPVYQFSRNFDNPHSSAQHNNRWVSGGNIIDPEKKITLFNQEVPQEIRQAVLDGYFAINDSYPPAENDFALIAREIDDKYAVLAVANRQIDDRDRPTIGYKYFWLEKTNPDIDGIGTLIFWWPYDVKYQFDMEELNSASKPEIYHAQILNKMNFAEPWLEKIKETVNNFKYIPCTGVVKKEDWEGLPSYIKLHYLSLGLSFRSDSLNAWAWNVQKLSFAENFVYILYSTSADIPPNLYKQPLPDKIIITSNDSQSDNSEKNSESTNQNENTPSDDAENKNSAQTENSDTCNDSQSDNSEKNSESTNQNPNTPPHDPENKNPNEQKNRVQPPVQKIKTCLTEIARSFHSKNELDVKKAEELFGYLADYSNINWSAFIDETTLNLTANAMSDIYKAEIYLIVIAYDQKQKWLIDLLKSIHVENKSPSFWDSLTSPFKNWLNQPADNSHIFLPLEFQNQLLKESSKYELQVQQRLTESIYYGITFFLTNLVNLNPNDPNHQRIAQQINYLLTEHQSIWNEYFQQYAYLVATRVFYQPNIDISAYNSVRKFCERIFAILEDIKNKKLDLANRKKLYSQYKPLALIFQNINKTDLAELFYRISGSQVPQELIGKIPLDFKTRIFPTNSIPTPVPPPRPNIILIIGILLFITVPVIYVAYSKVFNSIGFPQVSCDQAGNWLVDYPTFESCYRNADGYQKDIVIKDFMPDQTNIAYSNQEKQKQKAQEFIDGTPKGDESEFKRRIAKLQECQKVKATEYGNCLDNKQETIIQNTFKPPETQNENECSLNSREQIKKCNNQEFKEIIEKSGFTNIDDEYLLPLKQYLQNTPQDEDFEYKKNKSFQCFTLYTYAQTTLFQKCLKQSQKESVEQLTKSMIKIPAEIIKNFPVKPNQNNQSKTN